jgi:hypothetical protein
MNIWQSTSTDWAGPSMVLHFPCMLTTIGYAIRRNARTRQLLPCRRDDFNTFDTQRWQKATHTWNENNAQFVVENAVLNNGYLTLCPHRTRRAVFGALSRHGHGRAFPTRARASDSTIVVRFSNR